MEMPNIGMPKTAPATFIREVIAELKKVNWPKRDETIKLTGIVIVISVIIGGFIGGLDILFLRASALLLGR